MFEEVVGCQREPRVKHLQVDTVILFAHLFPCHLVVADRSLEGVVLHAVVRATEPVTTSSATDGVLSVPESLPVEETGTAVLVVTDQTV